MNQETRALVAAALKAIEPRPCPDCGTLLEFDAYYCFYHCAPCRVYVFTHQNAKPLAEPLIHREPAED